MSLRASVLRQGTPSLHSQSRSPPRCPPYIRAIAVNCVLGRRPKGRKENILGVENCLLIFLRGHLGANTPS